MSKATTKKHNFKLRLFAQQQGKCWLCGQPMVLPAERAPPNVHTQEYPTLDHVVPRSKGGQTGRKNLKLAHMRCNSRRGNAVEQK